MALYSYLVALFVELFLPFGLIYLLVRRFPAAGWTTAAFGAMAFIVSQVVHLPLVYGLTLLIHQNITPGWSQAAAYGMDAACLGLLAGLVQVSACWVGLRLSTKNTPTMAHALALGAGFGGIESILIGSALAMNLVVLSFPAEMGVDKAGLLQALSTMPWHFPLAGAFERMAGVVMHMALAVMVWISIRHKKPLWFAAAVLWQALADGCVVWLGFQNQGVWSMQAVLAVFLLVNLVGIFALWKRTPPTAP